jgi:hypothetical protein
MSRGCVSRTLECDPAETRPSDRVYERTPSSRSASMRRHWHMSTSNWAKVPIASSAAKLIMRLLGASRPHAFIAERHYCAPSSGSGRGTLGVDDYLLAKLGRNCSWAPTSGSWRLRWRWLGSWRRAVRARQSAGRCALSGRQHRRPATGSAVYPAVRRGRSVPGVCRPGGIADADVMKAG